MKAILEPITGVIYTSCEEVRKDFFDGELFVYFRDNQRLITNIHHFNLETDEIWIRFNHAENLCHINNKDLLP